MNAFFSLEISVGIIVHLITQGYGIEV